MKSTRWGILGCGSIAVKFMHSMKLVSDGEVVACASRTPGKAAAFASEHGVPNDYDSYEALLDCDDVDAVYIATTHNFHLENCLLALEARKAVLCEKPLATNAEECRQIVAKARESDCFLMEGMWTRFLPAIRQMMTWIEAGEIGSLKMLRADFCIRMPFDPEHRLFNPELAGGAQLDTGIYPVSLASMVMGQQPEQVVALAEIGTTGVDEQTVSIFRYPEGRMAMLSCAVSSPSENRVEIAGTAGRIVIPELFLAAEEVELHRFNQEVIRMRLPFDRAAGFSYEIKAVHEALQQGLKECGLMPLEETLAIAETTDRILAQLS